MSLNGNLVGGHAPRTAESIGAVSYNSTQFLTNDQKLQAKLNIGTQTVGGTTTSHNADYAEVGEWADGNPKNEDRIGYFVAIDENTAGSTMVKATSTADVKGVTVEAPAFSGGCTPEKYDTDGNLLPQYDYVAVMGFASIIDNGTCSVNGKCMPADDGTAVPSNNNMGYHVISRIDATHIMIAVGPGADMLNRIKDDMMDVETEIEAVQSQMGANYNESIIALSVEGQTVTYIKGDGSTHTFTTQDTNTTYSLGTDTETGLTKLYATTGNAEDGTMTQKAIKTELDKKVGVSIDEATKTLIFTI